MAMTAGGGLTSSSSAGPSCGMFTSILESSDEGGRTHSQVDGIKFLRRQIQMIIYGIAIAAVGAGMELVQSLRKIDRIPHLRS